MSGPASPLEPVVGVVWTGRCFVDRSGQNGGRIGEGQVKVGGHLLGE
jgi:hypothetical protein